MSLKLAVTAIWLVTISVVYFVIYLVINYGSCWRVHVRKARRKAFGGGGGGSSTFSTLIDSEDESDEDGGGGGGEDNIGVIV